MSEWIKWGGGPCPVSRRDFVEVRLRCGGTDGRLAMDLLWGRDLPKEDWIIAYRLVEIDQ